MTATSTGAKRPPGRPPKSDEARAAERAAILAAARSSIRDRGPDISLDEIAAAAKVSKPKIYVHFADKAGLAEALAVEFAVEFEDDAASRLNGEDPHCAEDLFRIGIDAFTKFMAEDTNLYRFMVRSMKTSESDVFDNALLPAFQARTAVLIQLLYPNLDGPSREVASYAALGQVFTACEGWLQHRLFSRQTLVDMLVTLFLQGVPALATPSKPS